MTTITKRIHGAVLALATAAALGFGGAQAFAAPAEAAGAARCADYTCNSRCVNLGYAGGNCVGASCVCWET
jgi:hypothetical protein